VSESCRTRIPGWSNLRVDWTEAVAFRCTWEHLGVPTTSLGAPATSLGAPRISVEQSGRNNASFGNATGAPAYRSYYFRSTILRIHVFNLYSHLCIYVSIQLAIYTQHIWTGLRAIRGAPEDDDRVNSEIHLERVIE